MNFRQEEKGRYSVAYFKAKDLPAIVRMVKLCEQTHKASAAAALEKVQEADNLLTQSE